MRVDIVVGATYGDEGKSKFSRFYSDELNIYAGVIKVGGYCTNTFYDWRSDTMMSNEMLPAATGRRDEMFFIFPWCSYIDLNILKAEAIQRKIPSNRIIIDDHAFVTKSGLLWKKAGEIDDLGIGVVMSVQKFFSGWDDTTKFLVEGQGGYGLAKEFVEEYGVSNFPMLPPTMTASGIASLLDIAPTDVDDVILVSRIEHMRKEICPSVNDLEWYGTPLQMVMRGSYEKDGKIISIESPEITPYNFELVSRAILANDPSILVLNHLDDVDDQCEDQDDLTDKEHDILDWIERSLGTTFDFVGYGPKKISALSNPDSTPVEDAFRNLDDYIMSDHNIAQFLQSKGVMNGDVISNDVIRAFMRKNANDPLMLPPSVLAKLTEKEDDNK